MTSVYPPDGEPVCGEPYPLGGKSCERYPDHRGVLPERHLRTVPGGVDAWGPPVQDGDEEGE